MGNTCEAVTCRDGHNWMLDFTVEEKYVTAEEDYAGDKFCPGEEARSQMTRPLLWNNDKKKATASKQQFTWVIELDHSSTDSTLLGMECTYDDEGSQGSPSLIVGSVGDAGSVPDWNRKQTDQRNCVFEGDRIIDVNGVRGDAGAMETECLKKTMLKIMLCRSKKGYRMQKLNNQQCKSLI